SRLASIEAMILASSSLVTAQKTSVSSIFSSSRRSLSAPLPCSTIARLRVSDSSTQRSWLRSISLTRSEEHTSELQSRENLVCRLPHGVRLFPYTTLFRSSRLASIEAMILASSSLVTAQKTSVSSIFSSSRRSLSAPLPCSTIARLRVSDSSTQRSWLRSISLT